MQVDRESNIGFGIVLGQNQDPAVICVVEGKTHHQMIQRLDRTWRKRKEQHFYVRLLEQLPAGGQLAEVVDRVNEMRANLRRYDMYPDVIYVDTTGMGRPILKYFEEALPESNVQGIGLTPGDSESEEDWRIRLGKAAMVSRLQILLNTQRLLMPTRDEFKSLASELRAFELSQVATVQDQLFRFGTNDAQITALGIVVHTEITPPFEFF